MVFAFSVRIMNSMTTMTLQVSQAALGRTREAAEHRDGRPTQAVQERAGQAEYQHTATGLRTAKEAEPAAAQGWDLK
jgi:hypothetical protein